MNEQKFLNGIRRVGSTFCWYAFLLLGIWILIRLFPNFISVSDSPTQENFFCWLIVGSLAIDMACSAFVRGYNK